MSGWVLTLRDGVPPPPQAWRLHPGAFAGLSASDVLRVPLGEDANSPLVGDYFSARSGSDADDSELVLRTGEQRLDGLGGQMREGLLRVEGHAGAELANGMRGGTLLVEGDCGDFAACGMEGGLVRVAGNAGDWLGGAMLGERTGMRGGTVAVAGSAGARAGYRMRRGLILVGQDCGDTCGAGMLAGTIVAQRCFGVPGLGLRRGTLVFREAPATPCATFNDSGPVSISWLRLLARTTMQWLPQPLPPEGQAHRYCGDMACGGKGELLVLDG